MWFLAPSSKKKKIINHSASHFVFPMPVIFSCTPKASKVNKSDFDFSEAGFHDFEENYKNSFNSLG